MSVVVVDPVQELGREVVAVLAEQVEATGLACARTPTFESGMISRHQRSESSR